MTAPNSTGTATASGRAYWATRLRRLGQGGLTVVLLVIGALWVHELFVDPLVRQGWKLDVLVCLIPLGVLASLALGVAWALHRPVGGKR